MKVVFLVIVTDVCLELVEQFLDFCVGGFGLRGGFVVLVVLVKKFFERGVVGFENVVYGCVWRGCACCACWYGLACSACRRGCCLAGCWRWLASSIAKLLQPICQRLLPRWRLLPFYGVKRDPGTLLARILGQRQPSKRTLPVRPSQARRREHRAGLLTCPAATCLQNPPFSRTLNKIRPLCSADNEGRVKMQVK